MMFVKETPPQPSPYQGREQKRGGTSCSSPDKGRLGGVSPMTQIVQQPAAQIVQQPIGQICRLKQYDILNTLNLNLSEVCYGHC